jgi:PhnB protein
MPEANETAPKMSGVVSYVMVSDARAATALYEKAFGAKIIQQLPMEDGKRLMHCHLEINDGAFMIHDPMPEHGMPLVKAQAVTLHLPVDDPEFWWKRAVDAGMEVTLDLHVAFWGDQYGQFRDPFGLLWAVVGPVKKS